MPRPHSPRLSGSGVVNSLAEILRICRGASLPADSPHMLRVPGLVSQPG
jgi:hypothetical protein